jgi:hypothetical protein
VSSKHTAAPLRGAAISGDFEISGDSIIFKGKTLEHAGEKIAAVGQFISREAFGGGSLSATVSFKKPSYLSGFQLVLFFDPRTKYTLSAGIKAGHAQEMYSISQFSQQGWSHLAHTSGREALAPDRRFDLRASLIGSNVELSVNGATVLQQSLTFSPGQSQSGIWCQSENVVVASHFRVIRQRHKAFVVLPFSPPYEDIHREVTKVVCEEFNLDATTADETYSSGLIISDIVAQIYEARVVIADVSTLNQNVFYEIGFCHAINKPTILLAERGTKLPFDISGFRHLIYENTIPGKAKIEERLRHHLEAEGFVSHKRLLTEPA